MTLTKSYLKEAPVVNNVIQYILYIYIYIYIYIYVCV